MIKSAFKIGLMSGLFLSSCVATAKNQVPATEVPATGTPATGSAAKAEPNCCKASAEALDSLLGTVQAARKSADQAMMLAALAATENHIVEMKEHKKKCKGMMGEMMGGNGMMGMKGMKSANGDTAAAPSAKASPKTEPSGHEKHH